MNLKFHCIIYVRQIHGVHSAMVQNYVMKITACFVLTSLLPLMKRPLIGLLKIRLSLEMSVKDLIKNIISIAQIVKLSLNLH